MFKRYFNLYPARGFTIIEAIIALSVSLIGSLAGYLLIANMHKSISGTSAVVKNQQEGRIIVERISREIRESSPDKVWPASLTYAKSNYIFFYTPRDEERAFKVDSNGKPLWQRAIGYNYDQESKRLTRYEFFLPDPSNPYRYFTYRNEVVSDKVQKIQFGRIKDMVTISIRTFQNKAQNMANSYADYNTKVKLRND